MSAVQRSSLIFRLLSTPLVDLVRFRINSGISAHQIIEAATVPTEARRLIDRVVRRTRLWPDEKADVAHEMIAHFEDAAADGTSLDEAFARFGDVKAAAKLIRIAKLRNRPLLWQAKRWVVRGLFMLAAIYVGMTIYFYSGHPSVKVDYMAMVNAKTLATPDGDRAWPSYKQAIPLLEAELKAKDREWYDRVLSAKESDLAFGQLQEWIGTQQPLIELIAAGTQKPVLGFVYGPEGSATESGNPFGFHNPQISTGIVGLSKEADGLVARSLFMFLQPYLGQSRRFTDLLLADAHVAIARGDSERFVRRIDDVLALSDQLRDPFLVDQMVGLSSRGSTLDEVKNQLEAKADRFTAAQLQHLAHRFAGGRVAADWYRLDGEAMTFMDMVQRVYTDDGGGDGRIAGNCLGVLDIRGGPQVVLDPLSPAPLLKPAALFRVASRKELVAEFERVTTKQIAAFGRPFRDAQDMDTELEALSQSAPSRTRYALLINLWPKLQGLSQNAERYYAERDALEIAIALEFYRRDNGSFPQTIDALVPTYLPSLPIDPVDGKPLRYVLAGGKPLIYSVGANGVDEGGARTRPTTKMPHPQQYQITLGGDPKLDGDWILYPIPPSPN